MENGTEYPVLYLAGIIAIDAVLTGWDGNPMQTNASIFTSTRMKTLSQS